MTKTNYFITTKPNYMDADKQQPTGGLAIWRGDEYIFNFLFAIRLQFQPTNNTEQ